MTMFALTTESITVVIRGKHGGDIYEIPFTPGWTLFGLIKHAYVFTGLRPATAFISVYKTEEN